MTPLEASPSAPTDLAEAPPSLLERLLNHAVEFDFFQAVWLLERYYSGDGTAVGQRGPVSDEILRFRPSVSMGFPATDLCRMVPYRQRASSDPSYMLEVAFLGLYGVSTPLPLHYAVDVLRGAEPALIGADEAADEAEQAGRPPGSSPVRDFLDVFHHRLISLFFRSWMKYRFERAFTIPQRDAITGYLRLLGGQPPTSDADTLGVSPMRLLRYLGALTQHPHSASTLEGLLCDYWDDKPVSVGQFVGRWVAIDAADQNRLGAANASLGMDLTVGEQVFDLAGRFKIRVGPVDWETFRSFVPGGSRFQQTQALTRFYCSDPLAFVIEVVLKPGAVPETQLTSDERAGALGLTSWARTADLGETSVMFDARAASNVSIGGTPMAATDDSRTAAA